MEAGKRSTADSLQVQWSPFQTVSSKGVLTGMWSATEQAQGTLQEAGKRSSADSLQVHLSPFLIVSSKGVLTGMWSATEQNRGTLQEAGKRSSADSLQIQWPPFLAVHSVVSQWLGCSNISRARFVQVMSVSSRSAFPLVSWLVFLFLPYKRKVLIFATNRWGWSNREGREWIDLNIF